MKLLSLLTLTFLLSLSAFAGNGDGSNSFNADDTVKSRRKVYTFVKNSEASSITFDAGDVVCHDVTADDGISVDYCPAYGKPAYCMITESCAVDKLCKCLLEGYSDALDFTDADDDAVAGASVYATTAGNASAKNTPVAGEVVIGTYLDAVSASGASEAYLKF